MHILIIEDEQPSQDLLSELLHKYLPEENHIRIAGSVEEAKNIIQSASLDLVFLDVILGNQTCFDLLEQLAQIDFDIIFTSSYEQYALKAFRLSAVDYLMKPIDPDELLEAMERVKRKKATTDSIDHIKILLSNLHKPNEDARVALPTLTGFVLIEILNITRCESDNTYTTFHMKNGKSILISKTLKSCEKMLSEFSFFRVHNSTMINMRYVKEYIKGEGGIVIMEDGKEIGVARRRKEEFLKQFERMRL